TSSEAPLGNATVSGFIGDLLRHGRFPPWPMEPATQTHSEKVQNPMPLGRPIQYIKQYSENSGFCHA
ncbi:MAG TPA: hypothetical protein VI756_14280, partial [Blastocatellia bacterium]